MLARIFGPRLAFRFLRILAKSIHSLREHWFFGEIYELIDGTFGDYVRNHGLMYAAAVSFYALLSLIPLVILFISAASYLLAFLGNNNDDQVNMLITEVLAQVRRGIPYLSKELEADLRAIIQNRRGLGLAGLFALLAASSQVFRALEFAFARIFARRKARQHVVIFPRNFFSSKLLFGMFIIAVMGIFLFLEIFLRFLKDYIHLLPTAIQDLLFAEMNDGSIFSHLLTANIVIVGFTVLIKMFTSHRVQLRFAIIGGGSFYILWQIARSVYEVYINQWTNLGALYGGFATLVEIVLWVFFSSSLLLLCGELVQTLQARVLLGPKWRKGKRPARKKNTEEEETVIDLDSSVEIIVEQR